MNRMSQYYHAEHSMDLCYIWGMDFSTNSDSLALEQSLAHLRDISRVPFCFKPVAATEKALLSVHSVEHRCDYCMHVKADPANRARCIEADDGLASEFASAAFLRTCPFGVQEWLVPVHYRGAYAGCLFIGAGKGKGAPSESDLPELDRDACKAFGDLFIWIYAHYREQEAEQAIVSRAERDAAIAKAVAYIRSESRINLRAPEVARHIHLSTSRFLHRFSDCMKQGFARTVRQIVMEKAMRLVTETDLRVVEIAYELGYANQNHFAQHFKQQFGCTATEARRRARERSA